MTPMHSYTIHRVLDVVFDRFAAALFAKAPRPAKKAPEGGSAKAERVRKERDAMALKKKNDSYAVYCHWSLLRTAAPYSMPPYSMHSHSHCR